ncbi:Major Facilitator Superfamily protein [compost metagenome]
MGYGPLMTALLFLPWPLATAIIGPWAGRQSDKADPRIVASIGLLVLSAGLAALACLSNNAQPWDLMWRTALCGLGFGLFQSPNNREILTSADPAFMARAAALLSAARLLGQALGALLVGLYISDISSDLSLGTRNGVASLFWLTCVLQLGMLVVWIFHRLKMRELLRRRLP